MDTLAALLLGIVSEPLEETRWLVLEDCLEEQGDPRRAELLRLHRRLLATCCDPHAHPERTQWQQRAVALLNAGVRPCVPQHTLTLPGNVPLIGSFIAPGAFLMGGTVGRNEAPVQRVALTNGFFMGIYPVTQAQWRAVMETNPSHFKGPNHPVERVSWNDCQKFCAKLTAGQKGHATVWLPTEPEWEWACRAGTTTEYHFGDVPSAELANYDGVYSWRGSPKGRSRERTTPVGTFPPNLWGLHDTHGNVREWCACVYRAYPVRVPSKETEEPLSNLHVQRGGSWYDFPAACRAAFRDGSAPAARDYLCGFRVCFRRA